MTALHRAVFAWACFLTLVVLVVVRLDRRISWHWSVIFVPMWLLDFIALLYCAVRCARLVRLRQTCTSGRTAVLNANATKIRQTILQLFVVCCKIAFQCILCMGLEQGNHVSHGGATIRPWHIMLPFWLGGGSAFIDLTRRIRSIYIS
ncbi:Transmembrane protein 60 [Trichuris trichiura]|uniref:Transmembrane protein 60 n=1 Tax=Trichuris trichiura TaxID=36087 RepID=A0A077Z6I5_TRITR|nr:Transmembrane protein 60 [Trichuris trichiura]